MLESSFWWCLFAIIITFNIGCDASRHNRAELSGAEDPIPNSKQTPTHEIRTKGTAPAQVDALEAFERLVTSVRERARQSPICWVCRIGDNEYGTAGKWFREDYYLSPPRYDVRKTDSLVTPYIGTIEVTEQRIQYLIPGTSGSRPGDDKFDSEAEAINSTNRSAWSPSNLRADYAWRNESWIRKGGTAPSTFPFADKHWYEVKDKAPGELVKRIKSTD